MSDSEGSGRTCYQRSGRSIYGETPRIRVVKGEIALYGTQRLEACYD